MTNSLSSYREHPHIIEMKRSKVSNSKRISPGKEFSTTRLSNGKSVYVDF